MAKFLKGRSKVIYVLAGGEGAGLYSVGLAEIAFAATKVFQAIRNLRGDEVDTRILDQQKRSFIWQRLRLSRK